ncbi:MAG TPA: cation:proton antiporter [Stellaceae bacterium]|jgi:Kef-type K+ transport system membrane component KefB|nr:cation:proton antiporter [Stellaceae bacterium]
MTSVNQLEHILFAILIQLIVMIGTARLMYVVFRRLDQPGVIGEIVAGLMLGPSLLGHFFPNLSHALFAPEAAMTISILSQIGLVLLMFQIGADFEFGHLQHAQNRRTTLAVALGSIGVPFVLGYLVGRASASTLAPGVDSLTYSLFMGVAVAITAVPVMGRILREFGLTETETGVIAISAAAINDVVGWLLLAGVSAFAAGHFTVGGSAMQVGGLVVLMAVLWFVGSPLVDWVMARMPVRDGELPPNLIALILCLMFLMAMWTYSLGIFSIFGGFVTGLLVHRHKAFVAAWRRQIGQFVLVFFLPIFFASTGLKTNVLGLSSATAVEWLGVILAVSILGKIVPAYVAARIMSVGHHGASLLGTLMNTRGLMELIVLNIGFSMGYIPQSVFTMLVLMAVVTTVMTGPLLKILLPKLGISIDNRVEA